MCIMCSAVFNVIDENGNTGVRPGTGAGLGSRSQITPRHHGRYGKFMLWLKKSHQVSCTHNILHGATAQHRNKTRRGSELPWRFRWENSYTRVNGNGLLNLSGAANHTVLCFSGSSFYHLLLKQKT